MFELWPTGFNITFENGYTASVRWGDGNHCHPPLISDLCLASPNAEVACWNSNGVFRDLSGVLNCGGPVGGWLDPSDVTMFLHWVQNLPELEA